MVKEVGNGSQAELKYITKAMRKIMDAKIEKQAKSLVRLAFKAGWDKEDMMVVISNLFMEFEGEE